MSDLIRSAVAGVVWPAIPDDHAARMLTLQLQLEQSQWLPVEKLRGRQLRQFDAAFRHAVKTVPYYRERFAARIAGVSGWEEYRRLPVSTRRDVQDAGSAMHSEAPPPEHGAVVVTESSGSTGSPLVTRGTAWTQMLWQGFLLRDHLWHRRDLAGKLVAIRSKTSEQRLPGWGPATAPFATGPSVVRGLSSDLDEQLQWLVAENPDYLLSLATNLQALAERSLQLGIRLPLLKQARTYAESLRPEARAIVRQAWGVEIADSYSSEELGYLALQCPQGEHYHVQAESVILEVLNEAGHPCAPGEIGQIVVSTLHNFAMPLLRYASGDYAEVGEPCACGRGLPVLQRIIGRQRNMLLRPDGARYWPSFASSVWRELAPVSQFQVVQTARDVLEFRFVAPRDLSDEEGGRLVGALHEALGFTYRTTLLRMPEIPRARGGKYEDFICAVD
jgi:phenylacetate-CoA ligase